jgi:uncharacterized protein (DUF1330 family)
MSKGYVIGNISITDPEQYKEYGRRVPAIVAHFGGTYLVRGGAMEAVEGPAMMERLVVIEFESVAAARRFYNSKEYAPVLAIRLAASRSQLAIVEGI